MTCPRTNIQKPCKPIIVYCPQFDENSGGAIVLHYLVSQLRSLGIEAYGQPPRKDYSRIVPAWWRAIKRLNQEWKRSKLRTHPSMNVPVAPKNLLRDSIAVYPEIVPGNPFETSCVVRWMLNRKDFFNTADFGQNELCFYYQPAFSDNRQDIGARDILRIRWLREDVYFNQHQPDRKGACRMVRKGARLDIGDIPDGDDAIPVDGMSHEEIADVFNRTEVFYCHDPRTMYLYYAALCGCIPIIVRQPGVEFNELRPLEKERWGIAYGPECIDWALNTRDRLLERFNREREAETEMLINFVHTVKKRFG